jgi:hypothetical protein
MFSFVMAIRGARLLASIHWQRFGGYAILTTINELARMAGMAKLADAADLKSAGPKGLWGFDSPSRHQLAVAVF